MENGMFLINLKGKSFTAQLPAEPEGKTVRAEVVKADSGSLTLRIIPKTENSTNPMRIITTTQSTPSAATAPTATAPQGEPAKLILQIPAGTIEANPGEKIEIQILKILNNGNSLVAVKNNLFEVKLDANMQQLLKNITAEVTKIDGKEIELTVEKTPVQNLNVNYVKQEVGTFDLAKLMKAFGKFQSVDVQNITPDTLKQAIKNSGLFMENKLLNDDNMAGDEKIRAYVNSDNTAKDGITKMQVSNMLLAGGLLAFLKTGDENIDDTYVRLKRGKNGQNTLYVSTKFSQLGDTFIIIRNNRNTHDVMVKTEKDISDELKDVNIENTRIHWVKFNKKDLETMDVKKDIVFNMGNFEVIT
jgi:hypothetical protein